MSKLLIFSMVVFAVLNSSAQEFEKNIAGAKSAYASGNLEDTRFNLESALRAIDIAIGKEIMKVLPTTLGGMAYNAKEDNVTGTSGSLIGGVYVHRTYGKPEAKHVTLDIISDSPLMAGVNAILSMPMIMNSSDGTQKVIKVQGYKTLITRRTNENGQTVGYDLQTPFGNSMLTLNCTGVTTEAEATQLANGIPLEKVVKLAQ